MERHNKYDQILKQKLDLLEVPDMNTMWQDMNAVLDQNMPDEKKRKRFLGWFLLRNNLFLLFLLSLTAGCVTWYAIDHSSVSQPVTEKEVLIDEKHQFSPPSALAPTEKVNTNTSSVNTNTLSINKSDQKISTSIKDNILPFINTDVKKTASVKNVQVNDKITTKSRISLNTEPSIAVVTVTGAKAQNTLNTDSKPKEPANTKISEEEIYEAGLRKIDEIVASLVGENDIPVQKQISKNKLSIPPSALTVKSNAPKKIGHFIAGASINYHLPVSGQEMSTINSNGRNNTLIDYLPSIYAQYHFARKWHVQTEFQFTAPQHIEPVKMESKFTMLNPNKKEEETASLNKLYYLSVPVSIHYTAVRGFSIGTGLQYSYLRSSIIQTEVSTWEKSSNTWNKTSTTKQIHVKSSPGREKKKNADNPAIAPTQVDTLAQNLRSSDWRILVDLNYRVKKITTGVRFNTGLNNYINVRTGDVNTTIKDKNQALQLYIRYELFRSDRKRNKP